MDEGLFNPPNHLCECESTWSLVAHSLKNKPARALSVSALGGGGALNALHTYSSNPREKVLLFSPFSRKRSEAKEG